jgi:DivIVA domain-containing protein
VSDEATQGTTVEQGRPGGPPARERPRHDDHTAMFPHVSRWSRGYDPDQVDDFFARARIAYEGPLESSMRGADVRTVAFDLVRGGYASAAVDGALDRLEGAFVRRERAGFVARQSQKEWMSAVAERATTLYPRLVRPRGERFAPPERGRGYLADDVDDVLDRLVAYFDKNSTLTSADLRAATFRAARGERAYAEGPVDAYLDRAVEVLLAVE